MEPAGAGKTVVIVQSNYLPWRGYFDLMRRADEFILLDTVHRRGFSPIHETEGYNDYD